MHEPETGNKAQNDPSAGSLRAIAFASWDFAIRGNGCYPRVRTRWMRRVEMFRKTCCFALIGAAMLVALLAASASAQNGNQLCPAGQGETFNVNEPGCFLCSEGDGCQVQCTGPSVCICTAPGFEECCEANPCCTNCPGSDALECQTLRCACEPTECCSLLCPDRSMAPVADHRTLAAVAVILGVAGVLVLRRRSASASHR